MNYIGNYFKSGNLIKRVLASTIGHKGLVAPRSEWSKLSYTNPLFNVEVVDHVAKFTTNIVESPQLVLADQFLQNGVSLNIPLTERRDGRLELNMINGNLPARWALMMYEFGFSKNSENRESNGVEVVSYVNKEFDERNSDFKFASATRMESHLYSANEAQDLNNFILHSPIKLADNRLMDDCFVDLTEFIAFYSSSIDCVGSLEIKKAPRALYGEIKQLDNYKRRLSRYCEDVTRGSTTWDPADQVSSAATKIFTDKCVSLSNDNKKYHCDIGCSQGSLGFPLSSYYLAMHILFARKPSEYPGEYDSSNYYYARKQFQKEELVVLQQNLKKMGGVAEFINAKNVCPNLIVNMMKFRIINKYSDH